MNGVNEKESIDYSIGWLMFNYSTRDKDETTVGLGHSRRYCNTGYDQSEGRRPSTLKCIGSINYPSEIIQNRTASSREVTTRRW